MSQTTKAVNVAVWYARHNNRDALGALVVIQDSAANTYSVAETSTGTARAVKRACKLAKTATIKIDGKSSTYHYGATSFDAIPEIDQHCPHPMVALKVKYAKRPLVKSMLARAERMRGHATKAPRQTVVERGECDSIPTDFVLDAQRALLAAGAWSPDEQSPYKAFRMYLAENIEPGSDKDSTHMLVIGELRDDTDGGEFMGLSLKGDKVWGHIDVRGWKAKEGAA